MRLLLLRHSQTAWNREGRFQGQLDIPLDERGCQQARMLKAAFSAESLDMIYTSDLSRALETAAIVSANRFPVQTDERLREMNYGVFQGLTLTEMQTRYPESFAAWQPERRCVPPEGETVAALAGRVGEFLASVRESQVRTALVVSHGETLQMLVCLALRRSAAAYWQIPLPRNAQVLELAVDSQEPVLTVLRELRY